MTGYTDALVLEAPVRWWPSMGDVPRYPVDTTQSLLAAVTEAAMPWPIDVDAAPSTVGLSQLGRSIFATASWSPQEEGDAVPFVEVWNPLTGQSVHFPVCANLGLAQSTDMHMDELRSLDVAVLAAVGHLRFTHLPFEDTSDTISSLSARMQAAACAHRAYLLLHGTVDMAQRAALTYLESVISSSGVSSSSGALLFTGDTQSQRQLLDLLCQSTPSALQIHTTRQVVLQPRRLHLAEVLTLDEHEALEAVEVVLRPPPLSATSSRSSGHHPRSRTVYPCLLVVVEGLHLLEAQANPTVDGITHQLCRCLEVLHKGPVPALMWCFAEEIAALPSALQTRVGRRQVPVATATLEDRTAFFLQRLRSDNGKEERSGLKALALVLAEETAHWTIDRLIRLSASELSAMSGVHTTLLVPCCSTRADLPIACITSSAPSPVEPLHPVYADLYGMDESIRKLEELAVWPLTHLFTLRDLAIPCAKGVLLCGPSGSGKTALLTRLVRRLRLPDTRAVHVLSVDGLALIEKEVGRSEKNIAALFHDARAHAPTALFIDNLDALAPPRGRTVAESHTTSDRTLSTLLTEMDGVAGQANQVVLVVASAPSMDALDPAVCRPGRLDVHVQLSTPPREASGAFMGDRLRHFLWRLQIRFGLCANTVEEFSGSHLEHLVNAFMNSKRRVAPLSPAEVAAAVREVMLHVVERMGHVASDAITLLDLQQYVAEAFENLSVT